MKSDSTSQIYLSVGLIVSLLAFNCQAVVAQAASASKKPLTYESSLSDFKSINNETGELTASDSANEMQGMDYSKMSVNEVKGLDHSKMSPSEMQNMKAAPKNLPNHLKLKN